MVKSRQMRCGLYFDKYARELKRHTSEDMSAITDGLARFLDEEQLTPLLIRRAQQRRREKEKGVFH